jgi:hypothetical protein
MTPESEPELELEPDDPELPPLLPDAEDPEPEAEEPELDVAELPVDPELVDDPELDDPLGAPEDEPLVLAPEPDVPPPDDDVEPLPDDAEGGCEPASAFWRIMSAEPEHPHAPIAIATTATDAADTAEKRSIETGSARSGQTEAAQRT